MIIIIIIIVKHEEAVCQQIFRKIFEFFVKTDTFMYAFIEKNKVYKMYKNVKNCKKNKKRLIQVIHTKNAKKGG